MRMSLAAASCGAVGALVSALFFVAGALASGEGAPAAGATPSVDDAKAASIPGVSNIARARTNYGLNCQGCHLASGAGAPGRVPDMVGFVSRFLGAPGGREYLGRVPGVTNAAVDDQDLAELVNWTLYTFDPEHIPADFRPYTAEDIALYRRQSFTVEADVVRRRLLRELAAAAQKNEQPTDHR